MTQNRERYGSTPCTGLARKQMLRRLACWSRFATIAGGMTSSEARLKEPCFSTSQNILARTRGNWTA